MRLRRNPALSEASRNILAARARPGHKTTEFYVSLASIAAGTGLALAGETGLATVLLASAGAGYPISRGLAKHKHPPEDPNTEQRIKALSEAVRCLAAGEREAEALDLAEQADHGGQ